MYVKSIERSSAVRSFSHPAIVAVHEVGVREGLPFIVMDLIDGEDLEALLCRESLPPRRVAGMIRSLASAIEACASAAASAPARARPAVAA